MAFKAMKVAQQKRLKFAFKKERDEKKELEGENQVLVAKNDELAKKANSVGTGRRAFCAFLTLSGGAVAGRAFEGNAVPATIGGALKAVSGIGEMIREDGLSGKLGALVQCTSAFGTGMLTGVAAIAARDAAKEKGAWLSWGGVFGEVV